MTMDLARHRPAQTQGPDVVPGATDAAAHRASGRR